MRIRGEREGKGGDGLENEEAALHVCVQPVGVGYHQKLDLKLYFVQLLVLFPDPGAVIVFPFSKHGDDPYSTGLVEVRVLQEETNVKSFLKSKVLQKYKLSKVACMCRQEKNLRVGGTLLHRA